MAKQKRRPKRLVLSGGHWPVNEREKTRDETLRPDAMHFLKMKRDEMRSFQKLRPEDPNK